MIESVGASSRLAGVTNAPDPSRPRYLPALVEATFALATEEPVALGMRRLSTEQFDLAIAVISKGDDSDRAVHEARRTMKRLRAVLRLVRFEIGERAYRYENDQLRDAARLIAPVRDAAVAVTTVDELSRRFDGALRPDVFAGASGRLRERASTVHRRVLVDSDALEQVRVTLERSRRRFEGWPTEEASNGYGRVIRNSFKALRPGIQRTYARGRREMHRAASTGTTVDLHQWRKRVKYLRHQLEVLHPVWPEGVAALVIGLDEAGEALGADHDLAVLLGLLAIDPSLCPGEVERALMAALIQHHRSELQQSAQLLGMRIYADKPSDFSRRLGVWWEASHHVADVGFQLHR